jgi:hypothetical protein
LVPVGVGVSCSPVEVRPCRHLRDGHYEPSWAEVKLSLRFCADRATPAEVLEIRENGIVTIVTDEPRILPLWHHDPKTLAEATERNGSRFYFQGGERLLVKDRDSRQSFSTCSAEDRTPCDVLIGWDDPR